jgi:hypothetical protein
MPQTAIKPGAGNSGRNATVRLSSVIKAIEYNDTSHVLRVTFLSGKVYDYYGVPPECHDAFRRATSKGTFFNDFIRDRYDFAQR